MTWDLLCNFSLEASNYSTVMIRQFWSRIREDHDIWSHLGDGLDPRGKCGKQGEVGSKLMVKQLNMEFGFQVSPHPSKFFQFLWESPFGQCLNHIDILGVFCIPIVHIYKICFFYLNVIGILHLN